MLLHIRSLSRAVPDAGGSFLQITFRRTSATDRGTIVPELSMNLFAWQANSFTLLTSQPNGDGTTTETWRSTSPVNGGQAFARLRVTAP